MVPIKTDTLFRKKRFWAGVLLAQFLLFWLLSRSSFFIKLMEDFFDFQKAIHQRLFSIFPFSVGDLLYIALGIILVISLIKIFRKKTRNKYLLPLLIGFNIFYLIYQIFWGVLYFQRPLRDKLPKDEITPTETKSLVYKYLKRCKNSRALVQEDRNGVFQITDLYAVKIQILKEQKQLPSFLNGKKANTTLSIKPSLFKGVMSFSGILGYYNPFTAEAQYNAELPATYLPFTLAHESSHQLGYAREQEANFIGYLLGKESKNLDLRYSTEYFVLKSLLTSLNENDSAFVEKIILNYSPGMKRDRQAEKDFRKKHEGMLDVFFGYTNDLFLKSNQQEGSITYSYFVDLMVQYERISKH